MDEKLEAAKAAITEAFSDTSVSRGKVRERLEECQSLIDDYLEALAADDARDEEGGEE